MDVQGWIAAQGLGSVLDDQVRTLNPVVGGNVFPRAPGGWAAPREPCFVEIGLQLGQTGRCGAFMNATAIAASA